MRVLFDRGTPAPLIRFLPGHDVTKAKDRGWYQLTNGELLTVAEASDFDAFITTDKNIRYQQNLEARWIALVVPSTPQWPVVRLHVERIAAAV